jgi:hypothetical protein
MTYSKKPFLTVFILGLLLFPWTSHIHAEDQDLDTSYSYDSEEGISQEDIQEDIYDEQDVQNESAESETAQDVRAAANFDHDSDNEAPDNQQLIEEEDMQAFQEATGSDPNWSEQNQNNEEFQGDSSTADLSDQNNFQEELDPSAQDFYEN